LRHNESSTSTTYANYELETAKDGLNGRFPSNRIFTDVDNIAPGVDFVKAIEKSVGSCDVSCDGWQLIDEQMGDQSSLAVDGGRVSPSYPETLDPGATHVAWAKFKTEPGDLSGNKYSINHRIDPQPSVRRARDKIPIGRIEARSS